jgi:hypothetical protein
LHPECRPLDDDEVEAMITPEERRIAITLIVAILERALSNLAEEIVRNSVQSLLRRWTQEARAVGTDGACDKPEVYAGAWRGGDPVNR